MGECLDRIPDAWNEGQKTSKFSEDELSLSIDQVCTSFRIFSHTGLVQPDLILCMHTLNLNAAPTQPNIAYVICLTTRLPIFQSQVVVQILKKHDFTFGVSCDEVCGIICIAGQYHLGQEMTSFMNIVFMH